MEMNQLETTLLVLEEELLEAAHRVSKALCFGLTEIQPGQKLTNAERIREELNDVHAMIELLQEAKALPPIYDIKLVVAKKRRFAETLAIARQGAGAIETSPPEVEMQPRPPGAQESLPLAMPIAVESPAVAVDDNYAARKLLSDACIRLWNLWVEVHEKKDAVRTKARIRLVAKWMRVYGEEKLSQAIHGCALSPHHMGVSDSGTVYNSWELIFRAPKQIEQFIDIYEKNANGQIANLATRKESYADQRQHAAEDQYSYLFTATGVAGNTAG